MKPTTNAAYYWTAFCLDEQDPNKLHCTHKFFGDISEKTARDVFNTLDEFFGLLPLDSPYLTFDRPALFGKDGDVEVLLADAESVEKIGRIGALRARLDSFRTDEYPEYLPHVTTPLPKVEARVTGYALMRGKTLVKQWRPGERLINARDIKLAPIKDHRGEFDQLQKEIIRAFRKELYAPILKILGLKSLRMLNAKNNNLKAAINAGTISFRYGAFYGKFNATVSKELRALGAQWDKKRQAWRITTTQLPEEIRKVITASNKRWHDTLERIDDQFRQILPAEIADKVDSTKYFDSSLWKTDRKIDNTLKSILVLPKLTPERRKKIAEEWRDNLDLWIKDFAAEEIPKLRDQISKHALSGGRFEDLVSTLQKSYGVTQRKAQFLARQETNLLMAKFKEARYAEAGVYEYEWNTVAGSKNHPVRPSHLALKGKIFRFDTSPITTMPGEPPRRNNPGEDYNCRCFGRPVVRADRLRKQA